ncbi:uncharacterized protein LOC106150599 [Lingula anatina]|uniref:Uncharacterized protein LOC106150599 n=1 Tax=Lingula anatina TaxID=7574 RepID=A0A1S3H0E7_LINAN|nr:uncharacterized protein LOC106150599 [Lingula anatina]XP_013378951.1 uncharacterized protein LOC106150599 [Lingula anatina]|eukprot:XP_013378950.1 uncharacterized protein LOC106150599 [Lingula anatina]
MATKSGNHVKGHHHHHRNQDGATDEEIPPNIRTHSLPSSGDGDGEIFNTPFEGSTTITTTTIRSSYSSSGDGAPIIKTTEERSVTKGGHPPTSRKSVKKIPSSSPPCNKPDLDLGEPEIVPLEEGITEYPMEKIFPREEVVKMEREVARTNFLAESVIATDERLRVSPCTSQPYQWICHLKMRAASGQYYIGTGAFSTMLGPGQPAIILTCAHNLYMKEEGGYVTSVTVYPMRDSYKAPSGQFTVGRENFRCREAFVRYNDSMEDFAVIFVPDSQRYFNSDFGFGYDILSDFDLQNRVVTIAGYPGDKPSGTMWIAGGKIRNSQKRMIQYDNDTKGGQSGSPVWTWSRYNWMMIGIHGYGVGSYNAARRINYEFVEQVLDWAKEYKRW